MTEVRAGGERPSGGSICRRVKQGGAQVITRSVSLMFAVVALLAAFVFVAASSDYRNLDCREMPANQCPDAVGTMWMMALVFVVALSAALGLWRRERTDA